MKPSLKITYGSITAEFKSLDNALIRVNNWAFGWSRSPQPKLALPAKSHSSK
jgi:hypothetical protein